jgi:hypothetical protein
MAADGIIGTDMKRRIHRHLNENNDNAKRDENKMVTHVTSQCSRRLVFLAFSAF